ncbi:H-type lectin domain protein, partial [Rhizoctonia solani AG-3 Rhs1AP]
MLSYTYNTNDDPEHQALSPKNSRRSRHTSQSRTFLSVSTCSRLYGGSRNRIHSYIKGIEPVDDKYQTFKTTVHLDTWDRTTLVGAGCPWLDVSKWDSQFQFGRQTAKGELNIYGQEVFDITFDRPYEQVPKIVVWLYAFDLTAGIGLKAYTTNVTTSGFKLWFEAPGHVIFSSYIYEFKVSWVAVPPNWPNVTSGTVEFSDSGDHLPEYKTDIRFDKPFPRAPRVLVALNEFRTSSSDGLGIEAKAENVTAQGMTLSVKSGDGSYIKHGGVQYITIVD